MTSPNARSAPNATAPVTIAIVAGMALWLVAAIATGKREPWDGAFYWSVAYPVSIGVCAFLGHAFPDRPWRWALVLFEAQFLAMCIRNGELGNLWPMGMVVFAIVAVPGVVAAKIGARFARRTQDREA